MRETQSDDDDMQWESDSDAFPDDVSTIFSKNGVLASAIPSPDGSFKSSQCAKSGTESGMTSPNKSPKDCLRHDFADYAGETEPYTLDYYFQTGYITHKATRIRIGEQGLLWPQVGQVDPIDIVMDRDGELLGAGGGGFVRRGCHRPTRRPVAIKVVKMEDKNKRTQFLNDLYALLNVTSDFLITLFGAYIDRETGCFHTVLEFMDMGSLLDLQKRCPEGIPDAQLSCITLQVVKGLECLHTHSFVHRDIKLSNILINLQGAVKITDFGISKRLDGTNQCDTFVGTSTHLSPERIMGIEYGKEADIWSLGLCVYELACGKYPFENVKSFWDLFDAVNRLEPPILPDGKNPALQEFINKCLAIEPAKRFTALELQKEPFILLLESPLAKEDLSAWTASVMGEPSSPMLQLG